MTLLLPNEDLHYVVKISGTIVRQTINKTLYTHHPRWTISFMTQIRDKSLNNVLLGNASHSKLILNKCTLQRESTLMYGIYSNKRRPRIKRWGGAAYQLWSKPEDVNSVCLMRKIPVPNLKREKKKKVDCLQLLHNITKWLALEVWGTICYPKFSSLQHVINTVPSSSPYAVSSSAFCKPSLVGTYIRTLFVPKRLFTIKIKLDNSWSPLRSVSLWGRGVVSSKV